MSDFHPSPGAVGDLGNAVVNLTGTILGKLDDAQRASEYHNGVETLRRGLTEFDLQLEQNPEWQKYPELAQQKENELWAQVQTNTKHQGALNDLQQTWQYMRDSHYQAIGNISNRVRVSQYHGDAVARYDSLEKQVEAGTMTEANASSQMEGDMKSMVASGVFDPTEAFKTLSESRAYMQTSEAARKIRTEAKTNGWDAAIAKIPEIAGQYSELKSPGQIDAFTQTMERQRDYAETREKKEAEKVNGDIDLDLSDKWNHMILNDGTVTMNQMQDAIEHQDYKLMQGAQLHRSYTQSMLQYIREEKSGVHRPPSNVGVMGELIQQGYDTKGTDPDSILKFKNLVNAAAGVKGFERYATADVPFKSITWEDQARLLATADQRSDPAMAAEIQDAKNSLKPVADSDPHAVGKFTLAMEGWKQQFKKDTGRDPNQSEISDESSRVQTAILHKTVVQSISDYYSNDKIFEPTKPDVNAVRPSETPPGEHPQAAAPRPAAAYPTIQDTLAKGAVPILPQGAQFKLLRKAVMPDGKMYGLFDTPDGPKWYAHG